MFDASGPIGASQLLDIRMQVRDDQVASWTLDADQLPNRAGQVLYMGKREGTDHKGIGPSACGAAGTEARANSVLSPSWLVTIQ